MIELTTEYLVIVEKGRSEGFYNLLENNEAFNKFLTMGSGTTIEGTNIKSPNIECIYEVRSGIVSGKDQKFYQIRIGYKGDENTIEKYSDLLKTIRTVLQRQDLSPVTLRDDVSLFYLERAFPIISKIENLMRKLITYFMLTNVGKEWLSEASPKNVNQVIDKSKRKDYVNVLHSIDFIDLGDLLFKGYSTKDSSQLLEKIKRSQQLNDFTLDNLKEFSLMSNWERYFSKFVNCADAYLKVRWEELYELRCEVAHNGLLNRIKFERIEQLSKEITPYLERAIENLDKIQIATEDVEQLAESVVSSVNESYSLFINIYRQFQTALENVAGVSERIPPVLILKDLYRDETLSPAIYQEAREIVDFRNKLVHEADIIYSEQEIGNYISRLQNVLKLLALTWKDEVIRALDALGGSANLQNIYDYIEARTTRILSENWRAAVRKTLQVYSSDSDSFQGGEDIFQRLEKGVWALRDQEAYDH